MKPLLYLSLLLCLCGWQRPDRHAPVILIEQISNCQPFEWDTRPCQQFNVLNGFAGWERLLSIEEVNQLVATLDEQVCHPDYYANPANRGWVGVSITPVNPFGEYFPPHFTPTAWEVRCG